MPLATVYTDVLSYLSAINVADNEGGTSALNAMVYNNQPERREQGQGYDYQTPAAMVEILPEPANLIGANGTQAYDLTIRVRVEHNYLNNPDGLSDIDRNMAVFAIRDKVIRKLMNKQPTGCGPIAYVTEQPDYNHTNTYLHLIDFKCHYIETLSSLEDDEEYSDGEYESIVVTRDDVQIWPHPPPEIDPGEIGA